MRTIGVVQGGGDHYPFVDPSDDIKGVVADISLGLNKAITFAAVKSLLVEDETVEICIVDQSDTVLFNSANKKYDRKEDNEWGSYYRIVYWESRDIQLKLVLYKTDRFLDIQPENGILDLRTVFVKPKHVSTITIIDRKGKRHRCGEKMIVFQEGYNIDLSLESTNTNVRRQNTLAVNAGAGYGEGRTPCTSVELSDRVVRSINSVITENGLLKFIPEDGYGFDISPYAAKMYVYNTDTPCCSCDEMDDLSDYVADVAKKYWSISETVNDLRDKHDKNIKNWKKQSPTMSRITRDPFILQAVGDGCQNVMIRADYTNMTNQVIGVTITLDCNYFVRKRKVTTLPVLKTNTIYYQEDGIRKAKNKKNWIMKTTMDNSSSGVNPIEITTDHLEPGKTMSIQLIGIYNGYRDRDILEPTFRVVGTAVSNLAPSSSDIKLVDCSCSYSAFSVSDISNLASVKSLYDEVWEIKNPSR